VEKLHPFEVEKLEVCGILKSWELTPTLFGEIFTAHIGLGRSSGLRFILT